MRFAGLVRVRYDGACFSFNLVRRQGRGLSLLRCQGEFSWGQVSVGLSR